jgi:UDPglucose 6-dehydrogenase
MKERFPKKILNFYNEKAEGKKVALWGLSFKPNTDDIRESPALTVIQRLTERNIKVVAFDPAAMDNVKSLDEFKNNDLLEFAEDKYAATIGANALALATEWGTFGTPDLNHLAEVMAEKVIFDGRSIWNPDSMRKAGFYYSSTGRQTIDARN